MKKLWMTTVSVLLGTILAAGAAGCGRGPDADHIPDDEHDTHAEERIVHLDPGSVDDFGIRVETALPGSISVTTELPGEVRVNGDRMAHVAPRVGGVVLEVHASLGDNVRAGQLLAVLESRELADAKAEFLAAVERLKLATAVHEREERLRNERISSEQDFLDARRALAEARIEQRTAEQKLHALGFSQEDLDGLSDQHDASFTIYRLRAPFDGVIIDRHITIGETVDAGYPVLTVADLGTVWIDLSVYQKDIGVVRAGQRAGVVTEHGERADLEIGFVQPLVGEDTRTARARIVAPNRDGLWHPGCFVTATVTTSSAQANVVVPDTAVIRMEDGDDVVFVETDGGFEPRLVEVGRGAGDAVEIVSGLEPGERIVTVGGFSLKAELGKEAFGDGHGH